MQEAFEWVTAEHGGSSTFQTDGRANLQAEKNINPEESSNTVILKFYPSLVTKKT